MTRSVVVIIGTIWLTLLMGVAAIVTALFSKTGNVPHLVARFWGRAIIAMCPVTVRVKGFERLRSDRPCIYMANHQSMLDIPILLAYLKVQFRWVAKAELFRIPIFGRGMRGCGYISIDRANRKAAFRSLKQAAAAIRGGVSVMIFPEGTRSTTPVIQPFKKGGFVLAVDAGVPVVPVVIHGAGELLPKKRLHILPGRVTLEILPAIDTRGYTRKTKDELIARVHRTISRSFYRAA